MSDKFQGGVVANAASVSLDAILRKTADSTEQTGKVAADMTLSYWRQGGTRTAVTASDLGSVNAAWSSGGVKEVDATNMPGTYRIDWPDAAFAPGADWVQLSVKVASCFTYNERVPITSNVIQTGDSFARIGATGSGLTTITAKTNNLPAAPADESLIIAATTSLASSIAALPTASAIATAVFATVVENSLTFLEIVRLKAAVLLGKASGQGTTSPVFRDLADTKDRVAASVDTSGNRTGVTLNGS
jgi:hypothetical protein